MAAVLEQLLDFGFCLRELVLPNDQLAREPGGFHGGELFQDIERHSGHSDQKDGGNAIRGFGHSANRTEAAGTDK